MIIAISGKIDSGKDLIDKIIQTLTCQSDCFNNNGTITDLIIKIKEILLKKELI